MLTLIDLCLKHRAFDLAKTIVKLKIKDKESSTSIMDWILKYKDYEFAEQFLNLHMITDKEIEEEVDETIKLLSDLAEQWGYTINDILIDLKKSTEGLPDEQIDQGLAVMYGEKHVKKIRGLMNNIKIN